MEFSKSDIQAMLLDSAERLLNERAGVEYWREQRNRPEGYDPARWAQFAELGWLALPLPEFAGGLNGTIEDLALISIELGRALATEPYVGTIAVAAHLLACALDEERAAPLLELVAAGKLVLAVAHGEAGADPLSVDARDTIAEQAGGGYVLNGLKVMVLDGPVAGQLIVSATLAGEEGTALFLVDPAAEGVHIDRYPLIDGTRAGDVRFENVKLSKEAFIAGGDRGRGLLEEALDRGQIALMAQAVGSMEVCLKICGGYTRERQQFGVAIGSFQAIQHLLAEMFVAANQARSMLYHAIAGTHGDAAARRAAVAAAKIVIGEASLLVARTGIQVHGGYGVTDEYAISHHFRRLMAIEKLGGDIDRRIRQFGDVIFDSAGLDERDRAVSSGFGH